MLVATPGWSRETPAGSGAAFRKVSGLTTDFTPGLAASTSFNVLIFASICGLVSSWGVPGIITTSGSAPKVAA